MTPETPSARAPRPRTARLVPGAQPPTRHPRRGGLGTVSVGERLTVRFSGVDPSGAAVARLGAVTLRVPFGVPGEDAVVEVTSGGRRAEGRLVALLHKSPDVVTARCRHFGRCGGCQWQHLSLEAQRRLKTRLVKDYLKEHAEVRRDLVAEATGGDGWAYRNAIRAVFAEREGAAIAGYHVGGATRVLDIAECPVQHPGNEAILHAARRAVRGLRLPVYDRSTGTGLVRGVLGLASFSTGQALLTLSTVAPLPDPTALVHALIDQVPGLVGILNTVSPGRAVDLLGPRLRLLWGRDHIEDEIAGFRIRLRPTTELPASTRAVRLLVDAVVRAAAARSDETAMDLAASTPVVTFALAQVAASATGVAPTRRAVADAWDAAGWNGIANAMFTHRRAPAVLADGAHTPDVVVVQAEGPGLDPALIDAVLSAGIPRVVYLARSLAVCARDLMLWRRAGYAVTSVRPVDLLPQTSHVHLVVALRRG